MMGRLGTVTPGLLTAAVAFAVVGCAGASASPKNELGQGQTLTVQSSMGLVKTEVQAEGGHYAQGRNTFLVQFDPTTTELDKASAFMPVHGHATPAAPTISTTDTGYRVSDFIFSMPGLWNVTLGIT